MKNFPEDPLVIRLNNADGNPILPDGGRQLSRSIESLLVYPFVPSPNEIVKEIGGIEDKIHWQPVNWRNSALSSPNKPLAYEVKIELELRCDAGMAGERRDQSREALLSIHHPKSACLLVRSHHE
jgi:hypothetical protein